MGIHGFTESYSESYLAEHPELVVPDCSVCNEMAVNPVTCAICGEKVCEDCSIEGLDYRRACKSHKPLVTDHEIEIKVLGWRVTRILRHSWFLVDGKPSIQKTELVSATGRFHSDATGIYDFLSYEQDRIINRFLIEDAK